MLILFYNTLWDLPLDLPPALPPGFEVTLDRKRFGEADAVVFDIPKLKVKWWLRLRKRRGQIWVAWSKECEVHHPRLNDARFMSLFELKMTYHLDADVPHTYVGEYTYARSVTKGQLHEKVRAPLAASFISSNDDHSGREKYLSELARHVAIGAYGKFMRNQDVEGDNGRPFKLATISRYKFTLAFENAIRRDYVTEKFFEPLAAGSVPVYLGAPNIEDFSPGDHCYINAGEFPEPAKLAEYLKSLAADDVAYEEYLAWRNKPLRASFQKLLSSQHWFVALCKCIAVRSARTV